MKDPGTSPRRTLVLGLAAVLAVLAIALFWNGAEPELRPLPRQGAKDATATEIAPPPSEAGDAAARDIVAASEPPVDIGPVVEPDLAHPHELALDLRLVDAFGLPVPGANVFLAPPQCGFSRWPEATDARGQVALRWHARTQEMAVQVAVLAFGVAQPIRQLTVTTYDPSRLTMVVRGKPQDERAIEELRQRSPEDRWRDAQSVKNDRLRRRDELDVLCGRSLVLFKPLDCTNCHDASRVGTYATLARAGLIVRGVHPFSMFQDLRRDAEDAPAVTDQPEATAKTEDPAPPRKTARERFLERQRDLLARAPEDAFEPTSAFVLGRVRNPDGSPAALVAVAALDATGGLLQKTLTNTNGAYRLGPLAPGQVSLFAGGDFGGDTSTLKTLVSGDENRWDCDLVRIGALVGRALGENGGVLAGWHVEFEGLRGELADIATTGKDGTFAFSGITAAGQCLLWPADEDLKLPVVHGRTALPDCPPMLFSLDAAVPTRGRLRVHVAWPQRKPLMLDVRVCQLESGRVAQLTPLLQDEGFELGGLCPGPYQVQLGSAATGWVDCGITHVDGRGLWDLGKVAPRAPGSVRVRLPAGVKRLAELDHGFYRRTPAVDVLAAEREDPAGTVLVPAGELVFVWRSAGAVHARSLQVASDATVDLDLREP